MPKENKTHILQKPRFRIFIDEVGTHSYASSESDDKRYLGLTGIIFSFDYYKRVFHPSFEIFKNQIFNTNNDPDNPIILHRKDIVEKRGIYKVLKNQETENRFNSELISFVKESEYRIITVLLDKKSHFEQYQQYAKHPYHYCLIALLERYCGFLNRYNAVGDVLAESRGGNEDKQLKQAYTQLLESGTLYRDSDFFTSVLTSKEIKIKPKNMNINGLQFADILAHPCFYDVLIYYKIREKYSGSFGRQIREIINTKYNCWGNRIKGYGRILLGPK